MCKNCDNRQCYDGSFQEDDEQIFQGDGDLTAHDDTADLGHIDELSNAGGGNHKAGELTFDGTGNDTGQEHIGKAHDDGLAG